jgi:hypothetical protein
MSIVNSMVKTDVSREESLKLLISAIQAAPESFPKNLTGEDFAKHLIKGAEILMDYVLHGKIS